MRSIFSYNTFDGGDEFVIHVGSPSVQVPPLRRPVPGDSQSRKYMLH
jgi:hypothetical protein